MTPTTEALRRVFQRELEVKLGPAPSSDANGLAATAVASYEDLASHVARLIGGAGVNAILARSVHLMQKEFPWLSVRPTDNAHVPVQQLRTSLEGQDPAVIALAAEALVVNFADLLVALIGEHLTMRVFEEAWPDGFRTESRQERTE